MAKQNLLVRKVTKVYTVLLEVKPDPLFLATLLNNKYLDVSTRAC